MKRTLACPRACVALSDNFGVYEITKSKTAATWHDTAMRTYRVRQNGNNQIEMIDLPTDAPYLFNTLKWTSIIFKASRRRYYSLCLSPSLSLFLERKESIFDCS